MIWFCGKCVKTINITIKLKRINSISHKIIDEYSVFVKKYEFDKPNTQEIDSIFDKCVRDCYDN